MALFSKKNMYRITLNIIVEDVKRILVKNPLMTLRDSRSGHHYNKETDDLDEFLKKSSLSFDLVYDLKSLTKLNRIDDPLQAITLLNSEYYDGIHKIHKNVSNNEEFLRTLINHQCWNGKCNSFGDAPMNNINFVQEILTKRRWDGNCSRFGKDMMNNKKFLTLVINSEKWNGSTEFFGPDAMIDDDFMQSLSENIKWDGVTHALNKDKSSKKWFSSKCSSMISLFKRKNK